MMNDESESHSSLITHHSSLSPTPLPRVLAIDPGTAKCGVAVVCSDGHVLHRGIVSAETLVEETRALIAARRPCLIICGNGTGAKPILQALQAAQFSISVQAVEEAHTSEAARIRFVRENRPPFLQRLLPRSLRTPWLPYDDYVAVILAERYWQDAATRGNFHHEPVK